MPTVFLINGPVTVNIREALLKTYEATAETKIVITSRSCATSGDISKDQLRHADGTEDFLVDQYVSGHPLHPLYDSRGGCYDCLAGTKASRHRA